MIRLLLPRMRTEGAALKPFRAGYVLHCRLQTAD